MTRCVCPPEAGFVTLNYVDHAPYIDVTENDVNTKQAVILAVFIFSKYPINRIQTSDQNITNLQALCYMVRRSSLHYFSTTLALFSMRD